MRTVLGGSLGGAVLVLGCMAAGCSSTPLAMNIPGTVYS